MKFKKSLFSAILVLALVAPTFANSPNSDEKPTKSEAVKEIQSLVKSINFDFTTLKEKTVKVHFMINTSNEVVVLRTSSNNVDQKIKYALNYKSLKNRDLKANKVYILPITFQEVG